MRKPVPYSLNPLDGNFALGFRLEEDDTITPIFDRPGLSHYSVMPELRPIAKTFFDTEPVVYEVSTMFISMNYEFDQDRPPICFETMIFCGEHDGYFQRSGSVRQALQVHDKMVAEVQSALEKFKAAFDVMPLPHRGEYSRRDAFRREPKK